MGMSDLSQTNTDLLVSALERKHMSLRERWLEQLPVVAALCYSAQNEPDADEAVTEALAILDACEEAVAPVRERRGRE
jgi:hypothetical protein